MLVILMSFLLTIPSITWPGMTNRSTVGHAQFRRIRSLSHNEYVAMNLSFACSLRIGEVLGLTWDNIHISDTDISRDDAHLMVEKELSRVKESTLNVLGDGEIIKIFPRIMYLEDASTLLVLKTPKTESSIRKVWMPKTVAYILREWKNAQERQKEFLGEEYFDHNLVVALPNGRPCEQKVITNAFKRLKRDAGLPNVVFHSLRHSSTTYKLKLNHGDLKATQGDTGHAQVDMITKIYAHILDEDRKVNAQRFEAAFYSNPDLRSVHAPAEQQTVAVDAQGLQEQLQKSPELLAALSALLVQIVSQSNNYALDVNLNKRTPNQRTPLIFNRGVFSCSNFSISNRDFTSNPSANPEKPATIFCPLICASYLLSCADYRKYPKNTQAYEPAHNSCCLLKYN